MVFHSFKNKEILYEILKEHSSSLDEDGKVNQIAFFEYFVVTLTILSTILAVP